MVVLEAEVAGFGASGRNGGWCSALYPVSLATLAAEAGRDAAIAQYRAMQDTVAEVVRVAADEHIDADVALGGTVVLARSTAQLERAREEVDELRSYGIELDLLDAEPARARLAPPTCSAARTRRTARRSSRRKLVRGLADVVEQRGAHGSTSRPA